MLQIVKKAARKIDSEIDLNKVYEKAGFVKKKRRILNWIGKKLFALGERHDHKIAEAGLMLIYRKLPKQYKDEFLLFLNCYVDNDYSGLTKQGLDKLNKRIDIPFLNEQDEEVILQGIGQIITKLIFKRVEA